MGSGNEQAIVHLVVGGAESFQAQTDRVNVAITGLENAGKSAAVSIDGASRMAESGASAANGLERGVLRVARKMGHLLEKLQSAGASQSLATESGFANAQKGLAVDSLVSGASTAARLARLGVPLPAALAAGVAVGVYDEATGLLDLKKKREKEIQDAQEKTSKEIHNEYLKHQELRREVELRYRSDLDQQFRERMKIAELSAAFGGTRLRNG